MMLVEMSTEKAVSASKIIPFTKKALLKWYGSETAKRDNFLYNFASALSKALYRRFGMVEPVQGCGHTLGSQIQRGRIS